MQYIWVLPNGIVFMQLIVVLMYEILGEKNKRDFLKFRSPLYYSINKKSVFDIIIFDFLRAYLFIFLVFFLLLLFLFVGFLLFLVVLLLFFHF